MLWNILLLYSILILNINFCLSETERFGKIAKFIYIFTSIILVFLLLFRENVGVDWENYKDFYVNIGYLDVLIFKGAFLPFNLEPGFQIYISCLKTFGLQPNFIPVLLLAFVLIILYKIAVKHKIQLIVIISFYTLMVYLHYFEQIRMAFVYSLGIVIFTLRFYSKNAKLSRFIVAAGLFHYVGFFYMITYLYKFKYRSNPIANGRNSKTANFIGRLITVILVTMVFFVAFFFGKLIFLLFDFLFTLFPSVIIFEKYISYSSRFAQIDISHTAITSIILLIFGITTLLVHIPKRQQVFSLHESLTIMLISSGILHLIFYPLSVLSHRLVGMLVIPSSILLGNFYFKRSKKVIFFPVILFLAVVKYKALVKVIGDYNFF